MNMNIANKLTMLRVFLVPVFVLLMKLDLPYHYLWALLIFAAASLTDMLDGMLARKLNLITNFGKFLDPLADKALTVTAFITLINLGLVSDIVVIVIVIREFTVSGLRLAASSGEGVVIAASIWGKLKTVSHMAAVLFALGILSAQQLFGLAGAAVAHLYTACHVLMWLACALTVISGVQYLWAYRHAIDPSK